MTDLFTMLKTQTDLSEEEIGKISEVNEQLPLIADVTNADVFLDVLLNSDTALVVSQARPSQGVSVYQKNIVGEYASKENEPAVFHAFSIGMPVCDLKATTQENRTVRQNIAPIRNSSGEVIAVLIREKDVSDALQHEKKYHELARHYESSEPSVRGVSDDQQYSRIAVREMHHRVKNNLQLVASILNLQSRKFSDPEVSRLFKENVNRVLSIAAIHDILLESSGATSSVDARQLMSRLRQDLQSLIPFEKSIQLSMEADAIELPSDTATSVALVITELVSNAFFHAFSSAECGCVSVSIRAGSQFHTVTVKDNGSGFDVASIPQSSLGLSIVTATVHDKLKGKVYINSDKSGTAVSFDFQCGA